jgi:glutathione S-transferase
LSYRPVPRKQPSRSRGAGIAAYLKVKFPEPPLLGRTPLEKAQVTSWNWRVEFEGLVAIPEALRNSRMGL